MPALLPWYLQRQVRIDRLGIYAYKNPIMARPRINPEKHRKNVAITIDPDLLTKVRALAAQMGKSLSQLVDQLLQDWLRATGASDADVQTAIDDFIESHERRMAAQDAKKKKPAPAKSAV
jgi:hypothetical protein